jgi:hypothetical protein
MHMYALAISPWDSADALFHIILLETIICIIYLLQEHNFILFHVGPRIEYKPTVCLPVVRGELLATNLILLIGANDITVLKHREAFSQSLNTINRILYPLQRH